MIIGSETRNAGYPIDSLFLDRWSPRAMSGEEIAEEEPLNAVRGSPVGSFLLQQPALAVSVRTPRHQSATEKLFGIVARFLAQDG